MQFPPCLVHKTNDYRDQNFCSQTCTPEVPRTTRNSAARPTVAAALTSALMPPAAAGAAGSRTAPDRTPPRPPAGCQADTTTVSTRTLVNADWVAQHPGCADACRRLWEYRPAILVEEEAFCRLLCAFASRELQCTAAERHLSPAASCRWPSLTATRHILSGEASVVRLHTSRPGPNSFARSFSVCAVHTKATFRQRCSPALA